MWPVHGIMEYWNVESLFSLDPEALERLPKVNREKEILYLWNNE
jgi:hypothetical protein